MFLSHPVPGDPIIPEVQVVRGMARWAVGKLYPKGQETGFGAAASTPRWVLNHREMRGHGLYMLTSPPGDHSTTITFVRGRFTVSNISLRNRVTAEVYSG